MPVDWIFGGRLMDEGKTTAVYPYVGLKEITTVADCRSSVEDIGRKYEDEFGVEVMTPKASPADR